MITVDRSRLYLSRRVNLLDYLGPILQLQPKTGGGYLCTGHTVEATMMTDRGSVTRPVHQVFMPVGCILYAPNSH